MHYGNEINIRLLGVAYVFFNLGYPQFESLQESQLKLKN
jgi:hypothetical protein